MLSCHQQKCYIFVNFDEYNLFEILLLFTFLVFNLVFKHFFVIFHIFFGKYTLTCISHVTLVFPLLTLNSKCRQGNFMKMPAFTGKSLKPVNCQDWSETQKSCWIFGFDEFDLFLALSNKCGNGSIKTA